MYTLMMHGGIERKRKRMRDVSTIAMREWAVVRGAIALKLVGARSGYRMRHPTNTKAPDGGDFFAAMTPKYDPILPT